MDIWGFFFDLYFVGWLILVVDFDMLVLLLLLFGIFIDLWNVLLKNFIVFLFLDFLVIVKVLGIVLDVFILLFLVLLFVGLFDFVVRILLLLLFEVLMELEWKVLLKNFMVFLFFDLLVIVIFFFCFGNMLVNVLGCVVLFLVLFNMELFEIDV